MLNYSVAELRLTINSCAIASGVTIKSKKRNDIIYLIFTTIIQY